MREPKPKWLKVYVEEANHRNDWRERVDYTMYNEKQFSALASQFGTEKYEKFYELKEVKEEDIKVMVDKYLKEKAERERLEEIKRKEKELEQLKRGY